MQTFFVILILAFGFLITFQIAKASEYVAVLRGEEKARRQTNRINAFLLLAFLVIGLIGVYYCNERLKGKILGESASVQGEKIDLGRVQVDFTPEWISDPTSQRKIAVPRARITIRGSDKVLEIRDLERIQRLRKVMKRAEPIAVTGLR